MDRTLALAGVLQVACLVKQLAWKGNIPQEHLNTCVHSLFQTDPLRVIDVYENVENLSLGLQAIIDLFGDGKNPRDPDIARYTISLLHLERLLVKKPEMLNHIQRGVQRARIQATHFSNTHENVIANLANIYTDTLSTLSFRIHVAGEGAHLSNTVTLNKIRALLFAGIRSAVLWRQLEGSRWQLVFGKKALVEDARRILDTIKVSA